MEKDRMIRDLLDDTKYKMGFPPRERVAAVRQDLVQRGLGTSGVAIGQIAHVYHETIEAVLDEFTKIVIKNADTLSLTEEEITAKAFNAIDTIFREARSYIANDFSWSDEYQETAISTLENKREMISEHLKRIISLRGLDREVSAASVQVTGGQIGTLVIGPVNQSQLTASIKQIIQQGGEKAGVGRIIESLLEIIKRMEDEHKTEQAELYDLARGLASQIQLPKEERSPSTIRCIWDRIRKVGGVSAEVIEFVNDNFPLLLRLLGLIS